VVRVDAQAEMGGRGHHRGQHNLKLTTSAAPRARRTALHTSARLAPTCQRSPSPRPSLPPLTSRR
jgi:hypothetical protein